MRVHCLMVLLLVALWPGAAAFAQDEPKYRSAFYHDFRGKPLPAELVLFGHEVESFAKFDAQGLRITLQKKRDNSLPVGVKTTFPVRGDFEITFTLEILDAESPGKGSFGVGASLYVNKTDDKTEGATLGRLLRPGGRDVIGWDRSPGTKAKFEGGETPCTDKIVRLRLKRTGSKWIYQWAPGTDGEDFNTVDEPDFGTDELGQVVLRCSSGGQARAADVRFIGLRVRSDAVSQGGSSSAKASGKQADEEPKTASRGWLVAAGLIGLTLFLLFAAVGVGVFLLRRRGAAKQAKAASPTAVQRVNKKAP